MSLELKPDKIIDQLVDGSLEVGLRTDRLIAAVWGTFNYVRARVQPGFDHRSSVERLAEEFYKPFDPLNLGELRDLHDSQRSASVKGNRTENDFVKGDF